MESEILIRLAQLETDIEQLKKAVEIPPLNAQSRALWTIQDIAGYTGYSRGYIAQHLVYRSDFPAPANPAQPNAKRRYFAGDIVRYFECIQQQNQQKREGK